MRSLPLLMALVLLGCDGEGTPADTTGGGGGGSGGSNTGTIDGGQIREIDAGLIALNAQLCLITDLRSPTTCSTGANLTGVDIEDDATGQRSTADAEGFFTLPVSENASVVRLKVGFDDPTFHNVLVPLGGGGGNVRIPLVAESTWVALSTTVGLSEPDGTGSIVAYIVDNGAPVSGVEVISPTGGSVPVYDGPTSPNDWLSGGLTGTAGAAIMTSVPASLPEVSFSVSVQSGLNVVDGVPLIDGALTFVTYELP